MQPLRLAALAASVTLTVMSPPSRADAPASFAISGSERSAAAPDAPSDTAATDTLTAPNGAPSTLVRSDTLAAAEGAPHTTRPKRSLPRSLTHGARVFASDAWYVVSSPSRMDWSDAAWTAGVLGVTALLYANDQRIHDDMQRARGDLAYELFKKPGRQWEPVGYMGNTNKWYVLALATGYTLRIEPLTVIPAQILESHMLSGGIRNLVKPLVGRTRPFDGEGPRHFEFLGPGTSFPSGHASVDFELATILSHHVRLWPVKVGLYYLAASMAAQRVESDGHWMSDVFLSAVQGTLVARAVVNRHDARAKAERERTTGDTAAGITGSLAPALELRDGTPTLVWSVRF